MKRMPILSCVSTVLFQLLTPGCMKLVPDECYNPGETIWMCEYAVTTEACDCFVEQRQTEWACATSYDVAAQQTDRLVMVTPGVRSYRLVHCTDSHSRYAQAAEPDMAVRPICEAAPEDDGCAACAKTSCCEELSACADDPGCACWVECLSAGNDVSLCSSSETCGPAEGAATAASTCLERSCAAQCPGLGSRGGAPASRAPAAGKETR